MDKNERRGAVRAPAKLAMEIRLSGTDLADAESINVSANGVYFSSSTYIAALTKLGITLMLPEGDDKKHEVFCEGVVVRVEPESESPSTDSYEVACYFTSISEKDRGLLETYILGQMTF